MGTPSGRNNNILFNSENIIALIVLRWTPAFRFHVLLFVGCLLEVMLLDVVVWLLYFASAGAGVCSAAAAFSLSALAFSITASSSMAVG